MEPTVINVKATELKKKGYENLSKWLEKPEHLYIGRDMSQFINGAKASKWQNPFKVQNYTRDQVLDKYEEYIRQSDLMSQLGELEGKVLGCWCHPLGCHGHILKKVYNEMYEEKIKKKEENLLAINNENFPPL
jgi:CO dehydrogenase nickel-insertion accessory protein CooC1